MKTSALIHGGMQTFLLLLVILTTAPANAGQAGCIAADAGPADDASIRMVFGGDIVLGNSHVVEHIPKDWEERYFAGVRDVLQAADIAFGNFEDTLTNEQKTRKTSGTGRQFAFRSPPQYAELLARENFKIVNVANNHAFDFGEAGFRDTVNNLKQAGIAVAGLRDHAAGISTKGLDIAVLGFTYLNRFNMISEIPEAAERVKQAKADGKFVIATFHGGAEGPAAIWHENADEEFLGENRGNTVAFARAMIEAGADMVVGHGPHVLRAAECYQGKPIVYSLGNFVGVGGLSAKSFASVSALLQVTISPQGKIQQIDLVPLRFNEQKLPEVDDRAYGARLVNYLGQHAHYAGDFISFPVAAEEDAQFAAWFNTNSPKVITARR